MSFDFSALVLAAAANNNSSTKGATPAYLLPLEAARTAIKIKDGNRKPAEDGSQALTLTLGKITLDLDVIAAGATRVNASQEEVVGFTTMLQEAIDAGAFDEAIVAAQFKGNPANRPAKVERVEPVAAEDMDVVPAGVDFGDEEATDLGAELA